MGNDAPKIYKLVCGELKTGKLIFQEQDDIELKQICSSHFYNQQDIIPENNLKYLLQLSEQEIFDIIFNIFSRTIENDIKILTYEDIKCLYCCFKIPNPKIKIILTVFLLF